MKYIPGHSFIVGQIQRKSASMLQQKSKQQSIKGDEHFQVGYTYKIHHIKPYKDEVEYSFVSNNENSPSFSLKFPSIHIAEQKISRLIGE